MLNSTVTVDREALDLILTNFFGNDRKYMNSAVGNRVERIITDVELNHDHELYGKHARFNEICEVLRVSFNTEHSVSHAVTCHILKQFSLEHMIDPNCP